MAKPVFYFSDGPYLQVMQGLVRALSAPEALVKLLGKAHTGKSLLCEKLAYFLRHKDYRVVYFHYAIESPEMLRTVLARELDLPVSSNFSRMIEEIPATPDGKPVILIFDDAHLLTDVTLLEIYRIAQIQSGATRVLNVVLCGEPALEQKLLSRKELNSLRMQMSHTFVLEAMNAEVLSQFLLAYLGKVGLPGLQLDAAAQRYFHKCSQGFPGQALELSRLVVAARQGSVELSMMTKPELMNLVRESQDNGGGHRLPGSQFREINPWVLLGPLVAVIVIASLALLYQMLSAEEPDTGPVAPETTLNDTLDSPFVPAQQSPAATDITIELPVTEDSAPQSPDVITEPVSVEAPDIPVSDSDLLLVTAAERGIADADIVQPVFESVQDAVGYVDVALEAPPVETVVDTSVSTQSPEPVLAEVKPESPVVDELVADTPASPALEASAIQSIVSAWMTSWQDQDLETYFAAYHPAFVPRYHNSRQRWRQDRERVISNASKISLAMFDYTVISSDAEQVEVQFWLAYRSPRYSDDTLKKLVLSQLDGRWLILEEVNLEVRRA